MAFPLGGAYLLTGGGALLIAAAMIMPMSGTATVPAPDASPSASASSTLPPVSRDGCGDSVRYAAVKDKNKAFKYAFANPASTDKDTTFDDLKDAAYSDPVRASGLLALVDRDFSDINNRPVNLVDDRDVWCEEVGTALDKLQTVTPVIEDVDAGSWTLVAVPELGLDEDVPVTIYQRKTTVEYQAAVYRFDTYTVRFLLDGGFSPVQGSKFDDVLTVPKTAKPSPSPSPSRTSDSSDGSSGSSSTGPVDHDPNHNGNVSQGGGTNTGLPSGGASKPSGSPPPTYTSPPSPRPSASSGGNGSGGSTPSPTSDPPSQGPSPSPTPESNCVVIPGVEDCNPV